MSGRADRLCWPRFAFSRQPTRPAHFAFSRQPTSPAQGSNIDPAMMQETEFSRVLHSRLSCSSSAFYTAVTETETVLSLKQHCRDKEAAGDVGAIPAARPATASSPNSRSSSLG